MHIPNTDFDTIKKIFLGLGVVGLGVSCFMTWKFGNSFSAIHGVGLVTVTIAAAFLFPARKFVKDMGMPWAARAMAVFGAFFICLELFADLGYTIGMRDKQMVEAAAQTVSYNAVQKNTESEVTNIEMWRKSLADLKGQNAWSTSVTADGLRAQLAGAQKAIDLETSRGGCKAKCLADMDRKASLETRIATLEKVDDLSKRIEATQRILDGKVTTGAATKVGHSTVKAQVDFVGKGYLMLTSDDTTKALTPDVVTLTVADWVIAFAIALGATFLPTISFWIAFFGAPASTGKPQHAARVGTVHDLFQQTAHAGQAQAAAYGSHANKLLGGMMAAR